MHISNEILSDITIFTKYAKYLPTKYRRETWSELVKRNMDMHINRYPALKLEIEQVYTDYVIPKKVLPSMRSLQFAGRPIEIAPNRIFNCAYLPIDSIYSFSETMFLLLGGTGVGYSVQRHHVSQLPEITKPKKRTRRFLVGDSIEGWADAIKVLVEAYFLNKSDPVFDFSDIRQKGAALVTSGGKAPGPQPLMDAIIEIRAILDAKQIGEKLTSIEAHDIMCFVADAVLAGGIRRAALISLFSMDDELMLNAKGKLEVDSWDLEKVIPGDIPEFEVKVIYHTKPFHFKLAEYQYNELQETGKLDWYMFEPQRGRSNNSAVILRHKVKKRDFMDLWKTIQDSKAGEPGVYFSNDKDWGTNPCCEIALRPYQFCNLVEVNASNVTSQEDLNARAKAGAFIGTLQAGYTNFHYLRSCWQEATEKDALIGVGMTGIGSGAVLGFDLAEAAQVVVEENQRVAALNNINTAARTTTVKPSGTSSMVVGSSSGIHAWHAPYYIRRMRCAKNETIYQYLKTNHPELVVDEHFRPATDAVIEIPQQAPVNSILRSESLEDILARVARFNKEWVQTGHIDGQNTHNVSCTISLKDENWAQCGEWMWQNRSTFNGISVLPYDGGTYIQAPFEDITEERYNQMVKHLHEIDLSKVVEIADDTNLSGELACAGGACEL